MPDMDRQKFDFPCPDCGRDIEIKYQQVWSGSREIRCKRCRAEVKFDSNLASRARQEASDLDRARANFAKALQNVLSQKIEITTG